MVRSLRKSYDPANPLLADDQTFKQEDYMIPPFEEALDDLINRYAERAGWRDDVISALELKLMALKEEGDDE